MRGQNNAILQKADSLFSAKQYTQSFRLYDSLLRDQKYSPAMLLKMAYIKEGLDQPSALYYLSLYQQATDDEQTLVKMEELADKYHLEGYKPNAQTQLNAWISKNLDSIKWVIATVLFFFFAWLVFQKKRNKELAVPAFFLVITAIALAWFINLGEPKPQIMVAKSRVYLMSGPSAGASVVDILEEGHRLKVSGEKDVWLRVTWREKEAFIKKSNTISTAL
ncbi:MAG: hypothetical protein HOP30_12060 [Cyclobacteriaceae bacterium]|nr:hypothetical protein [Cyclobacteriaceae bacterium]